jgi:chaperonin GroEL
MKELIKSPTTQELMNKGIQDIASIVECTLGPYGRNVAIMNTRDERSQPLLTDDGVRVVEFALNALTGLELLGAKLVYTSSKKTEEDAGDGTTSTYLLASNIISKYMEYLEEGHRVNPVLVRRGMNKAKDHILEYLKAVVVTDTSEEILVNIATSSSSSDEIGKIVGELRHKLGPDGLVNIRQSRNNTDVINYSKGYEFSEGFTHQELFSPKPVDCYDPMVLVVDRMIMTVEDASALVNAYAKLLNKYSLSSDTPLVVLCNKLEGEALKVIYHNWFMRSDKISVPIIPIEVPLTTDHAGTFEDLSIISGAKIISSQGAKLDVVELVNSVGFVSNVKTSKKMTYIVAKDDEETTTRIDNLIKDLKAEQDEITTIDENAEYATLAVRISKLNGVAVTIEVGAPTDIERNERKLKYDDAVLATHAASREGVVLGAGYTYYKAYHWIHDHYQDYMNSLKIDHPSEYVGYNLLVDSLKLPFELIPKNSGFIDYNLELSNRTSDELENIILYINLDTFELETLSNDEARVYDPYLVAKSVIENAVSATSLFVSAENSVLVEFK